MLGLGLCRYKKRRRPPRALNLCFVACRHLGVPERKEGMLQEGRPITYHHECVIQTMPMYSTWNHAHHLQLLMFNFDVNINTK